MTRDPGGLRTSIEARLRSKAEQTGLDVNRLRRHFVFQRMLARLALDPRWVLKGGFALEVRLALGGRATKDLDLVLLELVMDGRLQDLLDEVLSQRVDDDCMVFRVGQPRPLAPDEARNPGCRVMVTTGLAGREFQKVVVDVVSRSERSPVASSGWSSSPS